MTPPLVSIVMPSFNQAEFIGEAIDSVFGQTGAELELIVSDGGSTDETCDILAEKAHTYSGLRWTSRPDNGPADALNAALAQVRGTVIGWLNSDDRYTPGAVARALKAFETDPHILLCYGQGEHINARGDVTGRYPTRPPAAGPQAFQAGCFICQPTMFFKWSAHRLLGPLDESWKTSFDYDYWLRAFKQFPDRIGFVDAVQAQSRLHGDCITLRMRRTVAIEGVRVTARHLGRAETHWLSTYLENVHQQSPEERGFDDFASHARQTINEVRDCLSDRQVAELLGALKADWTGSERMG